MSQPTRDPKVVAKAAAKALSREYEASLTDEQRQDLAKWWMLSMARREPIRTTSTDTSESGLTESYEPAKAFAELPSAVQKQVKKLLSQYSTDKIYDICLGLAPRIRSFVKRIWKREDKNGEDWPTIASEMAETAHKILMHRIDIVLFFGVCGARR